MDTKQYIEVAAIGIMALSVVLVIAERSYSKRGIGVRVIQFLAVCFVVPAVLILSLERHLSNETTAALLGALIGYLLSGISENDPERRKGASGSRSSGDD